MCVGLVTAALIAACGGGDGPTDPGGNGGGGGGGGGSGENQTVSVDDNFFSPANVTVQSGRTVTWEHDGQVDHNITPEGHSEWTTRNFPVGAADFTVTFDETGTYDYTCTIHSGMDGTVTVESAS